MPVSRTISASVRCGNAFRISLFARMVAGAAWPTPAMQTVSVEVFKRRTFTQTRRTRRRQRLFLADRGEITRHVVARHSTARPGGLQAGDRGRIESGFLRQLGGARR